MISRLVTLCLPSIGSVSLCFPSRSSSIRISSLVSLCLSLYWIQFHHDFEASLRLSPFIALLLDAVPSEFRRLSPFVFIPCTGSGSIVILRFLFVCLLLSLSPFYWIQFHHDFEAISLCVSLCPPSTEFSSAMISRMASLCFPSTESSSVVISRLVCLCPLLLDQAPSWFRGSSSIVFNACLPLSSFYWLQFHHDLNISPFVSLLRYPGPSWFRMRLLVSPPLSPFYWIQVGHVFVVSFVSFVLDPVRTWFRFVSAFVSLLRDPVPSWLSRSPLYWIQFRHDFEAWFLCFACMGSITISRLASLSLVPLPPFNSLAQRSKSTMLGACLHVVPCSICGRGHDLKSPANKKGGLRSMLV